MRLLAIFKALKSVYVIQGDLNEKNSVTLS